MTFHRFTDTHGNPVMADFERGIMIQRDSESTSAVSFSGNDIFCKGTPEEVARLLAGEGEGCIECHGKQGEIDAQEDILEHTNSQIDTVTQERDRWRKMEGDANDKLAAVTAERDQARNARDIWKSQLDERTRERDEARAKLVPMETFAFALGWAGPDVQSVDAFFAMMTRRKDAPPAAEPEEPAGETECAACHEPHCNICHRQRSICDCGEPGEPAKETGEEWTSGEIVEPLPTEPTGPDADIGPWLPDGSVTTPPAPVTPAPVEPTPAAPTTDWPSWPPSSTSGIMPSWGAGRCLPLTRESGGEFLPGCRFVLFLWSASTFKIVPDGRATDGPATHPIRWRVNRGTNPFTEDMGSSDASYVFNPPPAHKPPKLWPVATGPISIADLGAPLTDANGSKWWRVEAWEDQSAVANKSEATIRPTVFFVCELAEGQTAPKPPAIGYHASEPIVIGSPVVHPIVFTTDNDPSPSEGEESANLLFRDEDHLVQILANAPAGLQATVRKLVRDGFQSKRNGKYLVDRNAGHHLTLRNQSPQYSALITAFRLLDGTADDAGPAWLHDYALNNGLSAPEIQIGEHGDRTSLWGAFSYDTAFEETFCTLFVYAQGKRFDLWTPSEEARIRDQLARFVWTTLQLHRNPYARFIHDNGACKAMWESARDQVCALILIVMPRYHSPQYGTATGIGTPGWDDFFIGGQDWSRSKLGLSSRSGLFGLLSSEPRWNADPRYFSPNNCGSPLAITLNALKNAGEPVPDYYEDAMLLALDGKLPGAMGVTFWSPAMCNDNWPRLKKAILVKHGKAAVVAAMTNISHTSRTADGKIPGGMGAGTPVIGLLCAEVV